MPDAVPNADESHQLLYRGASGQMAVMSEFLYRLINVAEPVVDTGDDVFVVRQKDETVIRVQAKYSRADGRDDGSYVAQFHLPWEQLDAEDRPRLVYVFAIRHRDLWSDFMVIRRSVLKHLQGEVGVGTVTNNKATGEPAGLKLRLVFTAKDVKAKGGFSLKAYRNAFEPWPPTEQIQVTG